jgi:hypothetical protein
MPPAYPPKSNTLWWVLGCGGGLVLAIILAAILSAVGIISLIPVAVTPIFDGIAKRGEFIQETRDRAMDSAALQQAIGTPMTHKPAQQSGMSTVNGSGEAWMEMDIEGPMGKARINARATKEKSDTAWTYAVFEAVLKDGRKIDLRYP